MFKEIGNSIINGAKVTGRVIGRGVKNSGPNVVIGAVAGVFTSIANETFKEIMATKPVSDFTREVRARVNDRVVLRTERAARRRAAAEQAM